MIETPFFFTREQTRLFGFLHRPDDEQSNLAFVFSHPFGEEKLWSHRVFVSMARALAARGHAVLRFDYMGCGDSAGELADSSLESHVADLHSAVEQLALAAPHASRVGLIGLRLGATFAALLHERSRIPQLQEAPLVLWDPIVDGAGHFQELLRSNLSTQLAVYGKVRENRETLQQRILAGETVNVDGYEIGKPLFESCARADLLKTEATPNHRGPTLVVQIAASQQQKPREDLIALAERYALGTFQRVAEQPFWREIKQFYGQATNLQTATLEWMEQVDG